MQQSNLWLEWKKALRKRQNAWVLMTDEQRRTLALETVAKYPEDHPERVKTERMYQGRHAVCADKPNMEDTYAKANKNKNT